jgi:hypothetical protein
MHDLDRLFRKDSSMVSRKIADEFILVPIRRKLGETESLYALNEVGGRIWELLDGQRSLRALRDTLVQEFNVTEDEAQRDLTELIAQLQEIGAIQEAQ